MKDWLDEYNRKLVSAEKAASFVKSGDLVLFTSGREAHAIGLTLAARLGELRNVRVGVPSPGYDFGWYDPGWEESFNITVMMPTAVCQKAIDERRIDYNIGTLIPLEFGEQEKADVLLTEISTPDEKGFCSFGQSLWDKRRHIKNAKLVLAEVNKSLIRTYGDNFVHVSEIDYFVEHIVSGVEPAAGSLAGRERKEPEPYLKDIVTNVSQLIKDRDTIQIGIGRTTEPLVMLGLLNGKQDIGWHSEATPPGVISLVREGVINGKCKTINPGKVVVTSLGGGSKEEMEWVNNNPLFWLLDVAVVNDIRVIAAHDNMVAINSCLAIDLTGQIAADGLGTRQISTTGGQISFVVGALLSKGGRSITVLPSTVKTKDGIVSRITPILPPGTPITTPRNCAQFVVTEYGIANLYGKSVRRRCEEIISIAHPDFRSELMREARKRFWP